MHPGRSGGLRISTDEPAISTQVLQGRPRAADHLRGQPARGRRRHQPVGRRLEQVPQRAHGCSRSRSGRTGSPVSTSCALLAADGTVGYAPFVVRPAALGAASRVAVILPTNTWQAYNFWDSDGNGWGDSWYIGFPNRSVNRIRPYLRRGVPPFFYRYDQRFLHWLYWTGQEGRLPRRDATSRRSPATTSRRRTTSSSTRATAST